ncbi:hypothetical protein KUTeg_000781 [Tegillarca granosa]|uniref:C2H2-type domain-containing protein n=1 Tax=Tegillarca granosa TaxID=220873 RepID=A0ABQ9FYK0_TEGGR|nr:hypothetical protein KUTeg_000781 [Tegillarca granosa]
MVDNHPGVVYKCSECRFMCHLKSMLDKHYVTTHLHRDKYFKIKCQVCDKTFGKRPHCLVHEFMKHGINHPSVKLHKCPFEDCEYVTVNRAILKTHELKHSEEKKFECQFCGTKLKTKTTYTKHIKKMHLGIRPHLCQVCGATFGEDSELSAHINNKHSTEKQFQCEHCPYATSSKSTFFTHLFMVHKVRADEDKRKEYSCPHCDYVTVIKGRFKTHLNGHKNIRDHVCSECGKQFITRSTLVSHKQWVHSGKVHSCNQCDYRTKTVQKLNEHVRVQHQLRGFKPYKCPYCDFTCATGGNCRKHVKQRHRDEEVKYIRDDSLIEAARIARQAGNYAPFIGSEITLNTTSASVIGSGVLTKNQPSAHIEQVLPMNLNMIWM